MLIHKVGEGPFYELSRIFVLVLQLRVVPAPGPYASRPPLPIELFKPLSDTYKGQVLPKFWQLCLTADLRRSKVV